MNLKVKITKIVDQEKVKAFATVSFEGCFLVTGVKVLESKYGLYVGMPRIRKKSGEFKDICFPLTKEMRQEMTDAVLAAYTEAKEAGNDEK